ncbi:hypothetical protein D3C86_1266810 [compost metagenome]
MISLWAKEESNRGLQVIAFLMAVTLWLFVGLIPRIDSDKRKMTVDVKVKNAPEAMRLRTDPAVAEVTVVGPKTAIYKLSDEDLEVFVDLKHRGLGRTTHVPLNISGPPGVSWELSPPEVRIVQPH